jgi:hypothetical protein
VVGSFIAGDKALRRDVREDAQREQRILLHGSFRPERDRIPKSAVIKARCAAIQEE